MTVHAIDALLDSQLSRYLKLEAQDLYKALYQAVFGCGHLIADTQGTSAYLETERRGYRDCVREAEPVDVEPLGRRFARVHLSVFERFPVSTATIVRQMLVSSLEPAGDRAEFDVCLERLAQRVAEGSLPLCREETDAFLARARAAGCPAVHHSQTFRRAYAPGYRVLSTELARYQRAFAAIDALIVQKGGGIVAIDGRCASGKTSFAEKLACIYDCNVFHMDDFFLRPHQRTPERYAEPGGNVDRERFASEVLDPLRRGGSFAYRPFDCGSMSLAEPIAVTPKPLSIVEGAYCMHSALADRYDLTFFFDIDPETQSERIAQRDGRIALERFRTQWIPMEERYIAQANVCARCDICLAAPGENGIA